jgi:drug/metabolite transporter (DMT)-like permease
MSEMENRTGDHFGTALAYLMLGVSGGLGLDLCAKRLLETYPIEQFVFLRSVFGMLVFLLTARWYGGFGALRTQRWPWHLLRTLLSVGAMFGFFYGLARMPLVNALTIAFMAPLIVTALSVPFLGEHVGWRRWVAVIVGFAGVVIVLRPGPGMFTTAAVGVIIAAFCWAGLAVTARKLALTESSYSLAFYIMSGPLFVSALILPGNYVSPDGQGWLLFVLAGLCSAIAWVGVVGGYRRAPPVALAPFEYTALIGAAVAGYLIWDEVPDRWVVAGGSIIMASGIYIVYREIGRELSSRYLRSFSASMPAAVQRRIRALRKSPPATD